MVVAADLIPYAADRTDQGVVGAGVDFAPQIVNVNVDHVGDGVLRHAPNFLDDGIPRNRVARLAQKKFEKGILLRGQFDRPAGAAHLMRNAVDLEILVSEHILG